MSSELVIRADADSKIGVGHVMRMIALGQAWQDVAGGNVLFLTDSPESLRPVLEKEGFRVVPVQREACSAEEMVRRVGGAGASWFAFDGYHFSPRETAPLREAGHKVLQLDDYGHRERYECDILLNQSVSGPEAAYRVNPEAKLLFGPDYALLRREFREHPRCERPRTPAPRLLVTMGGADPDNVTLRILKAISACCALPVKLVVLLGMANPHKEAVREYCEGAALDVVIRENVGNMVDFLFGEVDCAITAASSTVFELAYAGVPMAVVQTADNQSGLFQSVTRSGLALKLEASSLEQRIQEVVSDLVSGLGRQKGGADVDGKGGKRVVQRMLSLEVCFRPAGLDDARSIFEWRSHPKIRQMSSQKTGFTFEQHVAWLSGVIRSDRRLLLIGEHAGAPVGVVRFDCDADKGAEISIYLVPERISTGMGVPLLFAAVDWCWSHTAIRQIRAVVLPENVASHKMFQRVGFERDSERTYSLKR